MKNYFTNLQAVRCVLKRGVATTFEKNLIVLTAAVLFSLMIGFTKRTFFIPRIS